MDLQTRKLSFIQEFLRIQNEDIISGLEKMLKDRKAEEYERDLKPMSIEQFEANIIESLEDSANNRIISARNLKEEVKKWR